MRKHWYICARTFAWLFALAAVLAHDLIAGSSSAESNITSVDTRGSGWLFGTVQAVSSLGQAQGVLPGATAEITGQGTRTTDAHGNFTFAGLAGGTYSVTVRNPGLYALTKSVTVRSGEVKSELFSLTAVSGSGTPAMVSFSSPNGKHFIKGMPGNLNFEAVVAWNGSPGAVRFQVLGVSHEGVAEDLGNGQTRVRLALPAPGKVLECGEFGVELQNGEGKTSFAKTGVYFSPIPGILIPWYRDNIPWTPSGLALTYGVEKSREWKAGVFEFRLGGQYTLKFDPLAGCFVGTVGLLGEGGLTLPAGKFEVEGALELDGNGSLAIAYAGCDGPNITPAWEAGAQGKVGGTAKVVPVVALFFPPLVPVVDGLLVVPVVGEVVGALKVKVYFVFGGAVKGEYENFQGGDCFLGSTGLSGTITVGAEAQAVLEMFGAEAGLYAGLTGSPEWDLCPDFGFQAITLRGYAGVFTKLYGFQTKIEKGVELRFDSLGKAALASLAGAVGSTESPRWEPIGSEPLRWGEANSVVQDHPARVAKASVEGPVPPTSVETVVTNVTGLSIPCLVVAGEDSTILFALHDPAKSWYAATDIGVATATNTTSWSLDRIQDDEVAQFSPRATEVGADTVLAAWAQVSGDISTATDPSQVATHLEIVAAWWDRVKGTWTAPVQLTSNAVVDRNPLPVVFGATQGIVWVQNAGEAGLGNNTSGDQLMFSRWTGTGWSEGQTLWSGSKAILGMTFAADGNGNGHLVFAVDEDGNLETQTDRELYAVSTANSVWQPAARLTTDTVEDAVPALVAPNGMPICVWNAGGTLTYSPMNPWKPKPVYGAETLANEAATLAGVKLPGGAAVAYTVQGTNGIDIVASFYDVALDRWSLPRQLTHDEDAESSLSLASNGTNLVIAYLKTQTLRTAMDVEINGQMQHLESVPQPGRTDLCLLRHALGNDVAVVPGSFRLEPANPAPGSNATLRATIENRGDLSLQNLQIIFYDGDPHNGGATIGTTQVIPGPFIGGSTQEVSAVWTVPPDLRAHDLYVVADPALAITDRDRSNNSAARTAVLPDLTIETSWSDDLGPAGVLLTSRVLNVGVIPAEMVGISWRLGSVEGEEIARTNIISLAAGQSYEASSVWDTSGRYFSSAFMTVYAVVDPTNTVAELDETNNIYPQSVRVVPSWTPRILSLTVPDPVTARLVVEGAGLSVTNLLVESTESLAKPIQWGTEVNAVIRTNVSGQLEVQFPLRGALRFYRIKAE